MTPRTKRPRVISAVVATVDDDEAVLVDPENTGPSIPYAFVPVISGQGQWTHHDLTPYPLRRSSHMSEIGCLMFILCLFVFTCVFCTA